MTPSEFSTLLDRPTRLEDVWQEMVAFARECGAQRIGYHHLPPAGAPDAHLLRIENEGFGEALLAQYLTARVTGIATLASLMQNSVRPVYFEELEQLVDFLPHDPAEMNGRNSGVVNGLGIQAFGPNGRNGVFAIDLPADPPRLDPDLLSRLHLGCQAMHLRYCEILLPQLGALPQLSGRETEVLAWVARGKSNASIAEILGISAHTVDAHLRRIYLKLGVFDRISAALRGLGFGLISPDG